ncbi:Uncharacterised protein [Mycobacteroides abscessus subsp. abscessus]|nr:Uncharacterised protein [Mycobacteroides abscessus subsp. abscessus]
MVCTESRSTGNHTSPYRREVTVNHEGVSTLRPSMNRRRVPYQPNA